MVWRKKRINKNKYEKLLNFKLDQKFNILKIYIVA